jgi:DNA-binding response OmpR family regulator
MSIAEGTQAGVRVLIAEDGATHAQRLGQVLEQHGYRVTSAANGRLALEGARRHRPELVISDAGMPDMSSYELCAQIKGDPQLAAVPVIVVTALSDSQDVIRALECRADGVILKSYDAGQLVECIRSVLVNSRSRRAEQPGMALEVMFNGRRHSITADRLQILNLLLSTHEAAVHCSRELSAAPQQPAPGHEALRKAQHAPPCATRSLRVLLVDDDPALLESLRTSLEDEGHKVTTTNGGQAGIDAFREAQKSGKLFDIVITDFGMPYVDGGQVVASVRAMSPGTPIILLTGWGQHVGGENERPLHVDRLLGKPPRIRELRSALAELTGRRATDRIG